jgi:carboxymethylenebutenolidase
MGNMIGIHQQAGKIDAYLSVAEGRSTFLGAVIIAHEIWGLNSQIKGVADRLAKQGYFVLVPDLYSGRKTDRKMTDELQQAIFSMDEHVRYEAQPKLRALLAPTQTPQFTLMALSRLTSCFEYMYNQPLVHQRVAMVGFGLGGDYCFEMALRESRLRGIVTFYGHAPHILAELRHISCPVLSFYGDQDHGLVNELSALEPRMRAVGVDFHATVYGGVGHGFFNEQNPFAYHEESADNAWSRTLAFLRDNLA